MLFRLSAAAVCICHISVATTAAAEAARRNSHLRAPPSSISESGNNIPAPHAEGQRRRLQPLFDFLEPPSDGGGRDDDGMISTVAQSPSPSPRSSVVEQQQEQRHRACLTSKECNERSGRLGYANFRESTTYVTKGCFSKNGNAYWGAGGSEEDVEREDLPGTRERTWCTAATEEGGGEASEGSVSQQLQSHGIGDTSGDFLDSLDSAMDVDLELSSVVVNGDATAVGVLQDEAMPTFTTSSSTTSASSTALASSTLATSATTSATTTAATAAPDINLEPKCVNLLLAIADSNNRIRREGYYVLTNGMSNGYYDFNNVTSYSALPYKNKFGFVTLSCLCRVRFGGRENCCQGDRAHLDVSELVDAKDDMGDMEEGARYYVGDICRTTMDSIGENVLPPSGELPLSTTATAATTTGATTAMASVIDGGSGGYGSGGGGSDVDDSGGGGGSDDGNGSSSTGGGNEGEDGNNNDPDGVTDGTVEESDPVGTSSSTTTLSPGVWAGVAIAGAGLLTFLACLILCLSRHKKKSGSDEASVGGKEGVGNGGEMSTPNTIDADVTGNLTQDLPGQDYDDSQSMGIRSHDTTVTGDSIMTDDYSGERRQATKPLNSGKPPRDTAEWSRRQEDMW